MSLRSSERGLKYISALLRSLTVAVAPFVGAWIEMLLEEHKEYIYKSLRSSERGLKYMKLLQLKRVMLVAPFVGAWIEIILSLSFDIETSSRSVRRSVD